MTKVLTEELSISSCDASGSTAGKVSSVITLIATTTEESRSVYDVPNEIAGKLNNGTKSRDIHACIEPESLAFKHLLLKSC